VAKTSVFKQKIGAWARRLKREWKWVPVIFAYKYFEHWGLEDLRDNITSVPSAIAPVAEWVAVHLSMVTWLLVPIVVCILLIKTWKESAKNETVPDTDTPSLAQVEKSICQAFLYGEYSEFEQAYKFIKAFESGNKVYALWLSGDGIIKRFGAERVLKSGTIIRLLFPDPKCDELKSLVPTLGDGYDYQSRKANRDEYYPSDRGRCAGQVDQTLFSLPNYVSQSQADKCLGSL
jgi:hypothetical protein